MGEPFEAIGKFLGHSVKEVGKAVAKNPWLVPVAGMIAPPIASALASVPFLASLFTGLAQPTTNPMVPTNLVSWLPFLLLSSGDAKKIASAVLLPQVLQQQNLSTPQGLFTTMMLLTALTEEESKPILPQVFSPITPEQHKVLQKMIDLIGVPPVMVNPMVAPTVSNPFAPFVSAPR